MLSGRSLLQRYRKAFGSGEQRDRSVSGMVEEGDDDWRTKKQEQQAQRQHQQQRQRKGSSRSGEAHQDGIYEMEGKPHRQAPGHLFVVGSGYQEILTNSLSWPAKHVVTTHDLLIISCSAPTLLDCRPENEELVKQQPSPCRVEAGCLIPICNLLTNRRAYQTASLECGVEDC